MDILTALFDKADQLGLLAPISPSLAGHRMYIYADDIVLFATPTTEDLSLITRILASFGEASGLRTNMPKSTVLLIRCPEDQVQQLQRDLEYELSFFPTKYLGLPLSLTRVKVSDLQPLLGKLADRLPGWKAALLDKSGRLILVRVVLAAMPLHLLVAMDMPKWMIKAVDKIRRNFLWWGRQDARGGNCPVAWERVTRPIRLGGLGIHNLYILGWALRMR